MTITEFLESLPPALDLEHGHAYSKDVPPAIRRDIKLALKAGMLPVGIKVSVTRRSYKSVDVEITGWENEGAVLHDRYIEYVMDPKAGWEGWDSRRDVTDTWSLKRSYRRPEFTDKLNDALALLGGIAGRHNYDKSQIETDYFDVGYYLSVDADHVRYLAEQGIRVETDPALAELQRQAREASKIIGPKATASLCGRHGIEGTGKHAWEWVIKLAAKADGSGRPFSYDKRRRRWVQTAIPAHSAADCDATCELHSA